MFKGSLTKEAYEQCLTIGLCDKHIKKLGVDMNFEDRHELQRKAFLFIRLRILDPILFGKPFIFEKMKTLISKSEYFSMCNQEYDEMSDKTNFIDTVLLLDSIVVFTLCHFSKVCCSGYLFRNEDELEPCSSPDASFIQILLSSKNVTESDISHFNPILQNNFKGFDKNFIKFCYVIALLFVRTTSVKVKFKEALAQLSTDLGTIPQDSSNWLEKAKEAELTKNYVEAIKACTSALKYNPYNVVGLSHRASIYLNMNELKPAQLDSYVSVIIDPTLIQGYKILILSLGHQYIFEDSYQTLQYALLKCKQINVEEYEELLEIENLMKGNLIQENGNMSYTFKNDESIDKLQETKLEDVPDLSDASKSDDDNYGDESKEDRIAKYEEICEHLKEGSQFLLNECGTLAIHQFREVMNSIKSDTEVSIFEEHDIVVFKYAFGMAYCSSGSHDDLLKSISLFKEIIEDHSSVTFPTVYYGIGLAYYKLNRFKDSLRYLQKAENILEKDIHFKVCTWPGLNDIIKETKPDYLKILVKGLIKDCEMPPSPDAVCRFENCTYQPSIYYKDPNFKGFYSLHCSEQCLLQYHPSCWKTFKNINRYSDKEFLEKNCFTPDCSGIIVKVESINKEGDVEKMFEIPQAKRSTKQKKNKITKKCDMKEDKRKKHQNNKDSDTDKLNSSTLLETPSTGKISEEVTVDSIEKKIETNENRNLTISDLPVSGKDESYIMIKKENINENNLKSLPKGKETKKVKTQAISFSEFYKNSPTQFRAEKETVEGSDNNIQVYNQCTDIEEEFSDKINDYEAVKSNLYNYLEDFLIKNGPVSIKDSRLISEIESFPTEANIVIAEFGGIEQFLKSDAEHRFGIVDDSYLCSRENLAEAYKLSRNSVINDAMLLHEPIGSQFCELNPDAKEYTPSSSTSTSSNSFVSITEEYSSNIEMKKCISTSRQPFFEKTQPLKSNKAIQTQPLLSKSVGTMKTDEEIKRLNDKVNLLIKEKQDITIEKALAESKLTSEMDSAFKHHKDVTIEIECLKKELQDSNSIVESQTKEFKNMKRNLELESKILMESKNKIVDENVQHKKEIDILRSSNESLMESLKNIEISLESLKTENKMLRKTVDQQVNSAGNSIKELTKRAQNGELQLLNFKKEVFFKKIDDKILEATQRIKEIEICLPIVNSNSLYKSNLEALITEIHSYVTNLKKMRLDFQGQIDEQVNSVNNGILLDSLTPIEMKILPEIPSFTAQLTTNAAANNYESQLWNSQIFNHAISSAYPGMQAEISSGAKTSSSIKGQTKPTSPYQKTLVNVPQIKTCANTELSCQNVPPGVANLNKSKTISTISKSPLISNVSQKASNSAATCVLKDLPNELRIMEESSTNKPFHVIKETSASAVPSNPSAMCKDSSTVEAKKSCDNLSLELGYNVLKKKDLGKSQSSISAQGKSGNSYEKLLLKLKSKYPQLEESQLLKYIKEFRTKRKGGLSGLSIENIVLNVGALIDSDSTQAKKNEVSSKKSALLCKTLINKKIGSEEKEEKSARPQKLCAWGDAAKNSEHKWSGTNLDEGCIICYEDMSPRNAYKVDCGHCFHLKCIKEWLNKKSDCPICRVHLLLPEDYPVLS